MKTISIILTSLSTLAVILAIIFEGQMKRKPRSSIPFFKTFNIELKRLSPFAILLILLTILMNMGNGYLTIRNINDTTIQYIEDTINFNKLLKSANQTNDKLESQRIEDSIRISYLEELTKNNGIKSDSIRSEVVNNAVKALEEQRKAVDREREVIFKHFQREVEDNLGVILLIFHPNAVNGFADTNIFFSNRLKYTYIQKYSDISNNSWLIDHLSETITDIKTCNEFADKANKSFGEDKKLNIRTLNRNIKDAKEKLYAIYGRIYNLTSYKQYENFDFDKDYIDKNILNDLILHNFYKKDYDYFYMYDNSSGNILKFKIDEHNKGN